MTTDRVQPTCEELAGVLEQMAGLQDALHGILRDKLEAMRRADVDGMLAASHREGRVCRDVAALDERRRELADRLSAALPGNPPRPGQAASLRQLAARLEPGAGRRLLEVGRRVGERMLAVAEANRVVELVSQEMLRFFRQMFEAMVRETGPAGGYAAGGQPERPAGAMVLDAVG
jgi:predicted transposase YdaD